MRPIAWIPEARRRQLGITLLIVAALPFPLCIDSNDADIDSMANAAAYATLALGLNIVVGFAGLLDLGYAAFFAIGAYTYGVLTSFQLQPAWSVVLGLFQFARPGDADAGGCRHRHGGAFHPVVLAGACRWPQRSRRSGACCSARRRCGCAATTWRSSRSVSARSCRSWCATGPSLTNGAAGLNGVAAPQLFGWSFGVNSMPYYYVAIVHGGAADLHLHPIARFAHRARLDGDPRRRDRRRRDGRGPHASSSCWPSPSAPRSAA